jgi:hypothetical protein
VAGGRLPHQGPGSAGADYVNTTHASLGDRGSLLPKLPTGTVWTIGQSHEVAWTVKAFHGKARRRPALPPRPGPRAPRADLRWTPPAQAAGTATGSARPTRR